MADRVERIELFHVNVPLPSPYFPAWIPGYPAPSLRNTLLRVTTRDGLVGHATGIAFDKEREGLGDYIGQFLVGLDLDDVRSVGERLREAAFAGWRNSWIEPAFWDIAAQRQQIPLWKLIARQVAELSAGARSVAESVTSVQAYASFGENRPPAARAESIDRAQRAGFRAAKVVLRGDTVDDDLAMLKSLRGLIGTNFELLVHAHQASSIALVEEVPRWTLARARRFAAQAAEHHVGWLQEPLPGMAIDDQAALGQSSAVPVAAGDFADNMWALRALVDASGVSILTPDVAFVGLDAITSILPRVIDAGITLSPSCYSDGIGLLANIHAAAAFDATREGGQASRVEFPWEPPAMLPEFRDALLEDPIGINADGSLDVPSTPGLGLTIADKSLRRYAQRFYTLTPVRFAVSSARRAGLRQATAFARARRESSAPGAEGPKVSQDARSN